MESSIARELYRPGISIALVIHSLDLSVRLIVNIALLWSASFLYRHVLLTLRSSGATLQRDRREYTMAFLSQSKRTSRLIILNIFFIATLILHSGYGQQDYTRWGLPDGAKMRLGKGWISGYITFTPDGSMLVVPCDPGIWLYDVKTGAEVNLLVGHTEPVDSVAFSPDGSTLASGSRDRTVRLWDVLTWKPTRTLAGHTDSIDAIVFSPDGSTLASKSRDKIIRLWDVHTGQPLQTLEGLQLGSRNNKVRLWDAHTGETAFTLSAEFRQHWLSSIVFSPDRKPIVRVTDVVPSFKDDLDEIQYVEFSPDGSTLVIALKGWYTWWSDESEVQIWDTRTGEFLYYLAGHWSAKNHLRDIYVAFSPDGDTLASVGSNDSMVRLWNARTGELLGRPETFASAVSSIAFSPDGSTLVWNEWSRIRSWDVRTGLLRYTALGGHAGNIYSVAFSPDGATLASGADDGSIGLWDVRARENKQLFFAHGGGVTSVAFSPDGSMLASGGRDKTVRLWDARTGEHIRAISGQMDEFITVAFSHDGELLAGCSRGRYSWSEISDTTIRIWDARTGDHLHTLEGHTSGVSCLAFFPGVPILASGSYDNTIRIWDARTGENIHTLEGHKDAVTSVAFSPDGNTLVSGSWDSTILLWEFRRFAAWGDIKHAASDGTMQASELSPSATAFIPVSTALLPNYPNPFNPETWIPYQLKKSAEVTLTIYDMNGGRVRTLEVGHRPAGVYRSRERAAYWDGRNRQGELVANGVYFYTLTAADFTTTRKMLVGK